MSISAADRESVRQASQRACAYCGVSETDAGGELTIDHFRPQVHGGTNEVENLLYCCFRCNLDKQGYWPATPDEPMLWNPNRDPATNHFLAVVDGTLHSLTPTGEFTIRRLRLNRPPLVEARRRKLHAEWELPFLRKYAELLGQLRELQQQYVELLGVQRALLEEQRDLLQQGLQPPSDS